MKATHSPKLIVAALATTSAHGPLEPWLDKSWKPGDFELVQ